MPRAGSIVAVGVLCLLSSCSDDKVGGGEPVAGDSVFSAEDELAFFDACLQAGGTSSGCLQVGMMLGVVIPDYGLNTSCATDFVLGWVRTAGLSNDTAPTMMQAVADNC